jgi:hypothetical protein
MTDLALMTHEHKPVMPHPTADDGAPAQGLGNG